MANSLYLPAGTIVLSEDLDHNITLAGDVSVDNAIRQEDGGYIYSVAGRKYYACSGYEVKANSDAYFEGWRHRDGLVTLIG